MTELKLQYKNRITSSLFAMRALLGIRAKARGIG